MSSVGIHPALADSPAEGVSAPDTTTTTSTPATTGGIAQVQSTAHWTAIIGTIAVSVCLAICSSALAAVIIRDGNTQLVTSALGILGNLAFGFGVTLGVLVAGPQAVSAFLGRFGIGSSTGTATSQS